MNANIRHQVFISDTHRIVSNLDTELIACSYCNNLISKDELTSVDHHKLIILTKPTWTQRAGTHLGEAIPFHRRCWNHVHDCPSCKHHTLLRRENVEYCVAPPDGGCCAKRCGYYSKLEKVGFQVNIEIEKTDIPENWRETFIDQIKNAFTFIEAAPFNAQSFKLYEIELDKDSQLNKDMLQLLKKEKESSGIQNDLYIVVEAYTTQDTDTYTWIWKYIYIPPHKLQEYSKLVDKLSRNVLFRFFPNRSDYLENDYINIH